MRWMIFFFLFLVACDPAPDVVGRLDSIAVAGRLNSAIARIPEKNPLKQKPRLVFVDTVDIRTVAGQVVHLELWENLDGCAWVLGHDTIPDELMDGCLLQRFKQQGWPLPIFSTALFRMIENSPVLFREPVEVVEESELNILAALPDNTLLKYRWLVRSPTPHGNHVYNMAEFFPRELDGDKAMERLVRLYFPDDFGTAFRLLVLNDSAGEWMTAGSIPYGCRSDCDDPILYSYPYFGHFTYEWGSAYGSRSLHLYRLVGDTIKEWADIYEYDLFTGLFGLQLDNGGELRSTCQMDIKGNSLLLNYTMDLFAYSDEDKEVPLLKNRQIHIELLADKNKSKFIPAKKSSRWMETDSLNGYLRFNYEEYVNTQFVHLAKTGTKTQRKLLKRYAE